MSEKRKTVPRASIAVTILDDEDYIELTGMENGVEAFGVFVALIVAAKNQDNQGVFKMDFKFLSRLIRVDAHIIERGLKSINNACYANGNDPWVYESGEKLIIRSFSDWNKGWGGARGGAGRKPTQDNQDAIKTGKLGSTSASASSSATVKSKTPPSAWAVTVARSIEDNAKTFSDYPTEKRVMVWAHKIEALCRSQSIGKPKPEDVQRVIEWGLEDGFWKGQIRSAPDTKKFANIRAKMLSASRPQNQTVPPSGWMQKDPNEI